MSTVQSTFLRFLLRSDPIAKATSVTSSGQRFKGASDGTSITATGNNGSGLIRITSAGHGLNTGDFASIYGTTGTVEANSTAGNPAWIVTKISSSQFDLQGSTFANAWISGGTVVGCLAGSTDGTRLSRQRHIDIYNEARMVLFNALYESKSPAELGKLVYATFTSASITIAAYSAPYRTIAKPTGFLKLVNIVDGSSSPVRIDVLPTSLLEDVRTSITPTYTASNTNLLAFEVGNNWALFGNFGTTPAAVDYYGISSWTWATDVLTNTSVESFRTDLEPILIEIAIAIADEQSNADVLALAKTLLNKRG